MVSFKDINGREADTTEGDKALLKTVRDGTSTVREITAPPGVTTSS